MTVIKRPYVFFSKTDLLQKELDHISFVFQKYNNFPKWVINQVLHLEKENHHVVQTLQPEINDASNEKSHLLVLPYVGLFVYKINESNPQIEFKTT